MIRWKRKPEPLSQRWGGLLRHALTGAGLWAIGRWLGGEWGAGLSVGVVGALGYVWEHHTPEIDEIQRARTKVPWLHPFGDGLDCAAFVALLPALELILRL